MKVGKRYYCYVLIMVGLFLAALGLVVYDEMRTPPYMRVLEEMGYARDWEASNAVRPRISEEDNAAPLLREAMAAIQVFSDYDKRASLLIMGKAARVSLTESYPDILRDTLHEFVTLNQAPLEKIHEAMTRPYFQETFEAGTGDARFSSDGHEQEEEDAFREALLGGYSSCSSLLFCAGLDAVLQGDAADLARVMTSAFRFPELLLNEPVSDLLMYANTHGNRVYSLIEEALNRMALDEGTLEDWQRGLEQDFFSGVALRTDVVSHMFFSRLAAAERQEKAYFARRSQHLGRMLDSLMEYQSYAIYDVLLYRPFLAANLAGYREGVVNYYAMKDSLPLMYELEGCLDLSLLFLMPNGMGLDAIAGGAATRAALAAARYRLKHGMLPESLEALVPEYLLEAPLDPVAGDSTVRYEDGGDRMVFYCATLDTLIPEAQREENKCVSEIDFVLLKAAPLR